MKMVNQQRENINQWLLFFYKSNQKIHSTCFTKTDNTKYEIAKYKEHNQLSFGGFCWTKK